jgi:hypothetical protein
MRRLLLLTSLSLLAGTYAIAPAYAQGYGNQPPGYKASPPPAPYTGSKGLSINKCYITEAVGAIV